MALRQRKNESLPKTTAGKLDWTDLEVFLHVARSGTLSGAGVALGINASTAHRRIGKLEECLGTRLFDRRQRGYLLTVPGEALVSHAEAMEEEVLAASRALSGHERALSGTVRVATVDDLAIDILPPILQLFRREHPLVTIDVQVRSDFADLARRQADVAIRFGAAPEDPDVIGKRIGGAAIALYGSRAYLREHGTPQRPADLWGHSVVRGEQRMARLGMERFMSDHGDPAKVAFRSNSMLARLAAVRAGLGVGFLATFAAEPVRALCRIPWPAVESEAQVWMLIHADLRRNARVRAFVDFVHEKLAALWGQFELEEAPQ